MCKKIAQLTKVIHSLTVKQWEEKKKADFTESLISRNDAIMSDLRNRLKSEEETKASNERLIISLREQLANSQKESADLRQLYEATLKLLADNMRDINTKHKNDLKTIEKTFNKLKNEIVLTHFNEFQLKMETFFRDKIDLQQKVNKNQHLHISNVNDLKLRIVELERELTERTTEISNLKSKLESEKSEIAILNYDISHLKEKIRVEDLAKRANAVDKETNTSSNIINVNNSDITNQSSERSPPSSSHSSSSSFVTSSSTFSSPSFLTPSTSPSPNLNNDIDRNVTSASNNLDIMLKNLSNNINDAKNVAKTLWQLILNSNNNNYKSKNTIINKTGNKLRRNNISSNLN
ncbi:hypothetical protein HELRODRAFT_161809 [Helobdella robusta]|uniref:Uncharacterized protein n=1 Tax=Helobdella robusta TaxID=6412 RepID=T1ERX7_HELRO|nr:hypothetical protein HELRODRAFT_161809 [Helobdella robusta]ESO02528.1 hypothetical protein HELRODRAFT_161809 [Helobdella robusta]